LEDAEKELEDVVPTSALDGDLVTCPFPMANVKDLLCHNTRPGVACAYQSQSLAHVLLH